MDDLRRPVAFEMICDHVALVSLNRPECRNAVDSMTSAAIERLVDRTEGDAAIRAVVLASTHEHVFCAGADLAAIASGGTAGIETARGGFAGFVAADRRKPWIAAVDGAAVGGGFELALACEMIVASDRATFALAEVRRGLIAGAGGIFRLARALPPAIAYEYLATGAPIHAVAAARHGLVNQVVPAGDALAAAKALATRIADNAPLAVQFSIAAARESLALSEREAFEALGSWRAAISRTEDYAEGPRAFLEKRPPVWSGR